MLDEFAGMEFLDEDRERATPPDTYVAAGPDLIAETVNLRLAFYDRESGEQESEVTLDDFFAEVGAQQTWIPQGIQSGIDPRVTYDEFSQRFIVAALEIDSNAETSHLLLAVSRDSYPPDGHPQEEWVKHRINVEDDDKYFLDFSGLGYDAEAIYFTGNMLKWKKNDTKYISVFTFDKASLWDEDPAITYFDVDRPASHHTMQPAVMHGVGSGDAMYFVEASPNTSDQGSYVRVVEMTNKLSPDPTFTDHRIDVPKYELPPVATQPGAGAIQTNDARILNAAYRDGRLVAAHNVGVGNVTHARWYEFDTSGVKPTLAQFGEIDPGPGTHTYYPSIEINVVGDLGMTFMQSSPDEYMSMYITGQTNGDPAGSMRTPVLAKAGEAPYKFSDLVDPPPYRAGDYSGIAVDPVDQTTFWAGNEYATDATSESPVFGNWGTWIAHFSVTDTPTTTARAEETPAGTIEEGIASVLVASSVTGATVGSSIPPLAADESGRITPTAPSRSAPSGAGLTWLAIVLPDQGQLNSPDLVDQVNRLRSPGAREPGRLCPTLVDLLLDHRVALLLDDHTLG